MTGASPGVGKMCVEKLREFLEMCRVNLGRPEAIGVLVSDGRFGPDGTAPKVAIGQRPRHRSEREQRIQRVTGRGTEPMWSCGNGAHWWYQTRVELRA